MEITKAKCSEPENRPIEMIKYELRERKINAIKLTKSQTPMGQDRNTRNEYY